MKKIEIFLLFLFMSTNQIFSQSNVRTFDSAINKIPRDSVQVYIYGKFQVFPPDSLDRIKEMTASYRLCDTSKWKRLSLQKNGEFSFLIKKSDKKIININFSEKNYCYYPIEIKDINLYQDTLYLGIIPTMPDPFGNLGELSSRKHFFRSVYDYTSRPILMKERLKYEDTLNSIYNSFCYDCDSSIFTTKVFSWKEKRSYTRIEIRKLTISHRDLLSMSEYFSFNYPHLDSLARGFVNFMKKIPDSTFCDRFNKAVSNYSFPEYYNTPDSVTTYYYGQIIRYKEDSIPVIFNLTHAELYERLYYGFRNEVLKAIELTKEEMSRINNELLFYIAVDRLGNIKELKLLSLVNSDTRHCLDTFLSRFSGVRLAPSRARGRSSPSFKAALYIDLQDNSSKQKMQ